MSRTLSPPKAGFLHLQRRDSSLRVAKGHRRPFGDHATMPKTYTKLYYHLVWSTKRRKPWIRPEIQDDLYAFVGHKCQQYGYRLCAVNGMQDHIHVVVYLGPSIPVSEAVGNLKGSSSRFCNRVLVVKPPFRWQAG